MTSVQKLIDNLIKENETLKEKLARYKNIEEIGRSPQNLIKL